MKESGKKYIKALVNLLTAAVLLLLAVFLLPRLIGFFMPFVIGWIIAAIANPLVRFLDEKLKIKRKAGSAIVIVAVIGLVSCAGYLGLSLLIREGWGFIQELPEVWRSMQEDISHAARALENIARYLPVQLQDTAVSLSESFGDLFDNLTDGLSSPTMNAVGSIAKNIPAAFIGLIMCLLSAYFFVAQREEVLRAFRTHIPEGIRERWLVLYRGLVRAVGGYFKAQIKIEVWMYLLLLAGFLILRVRYAAFISLGIAVLDFFPVFGTGAVLIPWAVIRILGGNYKMAVGLLILWCLGQLARQIIQPKIVGDSVGLPALPTLFLLYIGYRSGGVFGMIIAVPVGIILVSMYQAGFFSTTVDSARILANGFNRFRRLTEEDKKEIENGNQSSGL